MKLKAHLGVIRKCRKGDVDPKRPGRKVCLYSRSGNRLIGRHKTRKSALRQERAIYARKGRG